jgi:hypothetical protein
MTDSDIPTTKVGEHVMTPNGEAIIRNTGNWPFIVVELLDSTIAKRFYVLDATRGLNKRHH